MVYLSDRTRSATGRFGWIAEFRRSITAWPPLGQSRRSRVRTSFRHPQGSIVTASAAGTVTNFTFFAHGAGATQTFTPKIYSVAGGQQTNLLTTGTAITAPKGTDGRWYVATINALQLAPGTQYELALAPSGGSTYVGSETNGQMCFFLDYTRIERPTNTPRSESPRGSKRPLLVIRPACPEQHAAEQEPRLTSSALPARRGRRAGGCDKRGETSGAATTLGHGSRG